MTEIAPGWTADAERSGDWLLVRLRVADSNLMDEPPLAERLWDLLQQHALQQLVLELDQIQVLRSYLVGQLVLLHKRAFVHGGQVRLCGLSPHNYEVIHVCRLADRFPAYRNRDEALRGVCAPA